MNSTPETKTTAARVARKKELIAKVVAKNILINNSELPSEIYQNEDGTNPAEFRNEDREILQENELIMKGLMKGLKSDSPRMWMALGKIHERRRYRIAGYPTFEAYCEEKWDVSRSHGNRCVVAAQIYPILSPHGDKFQLPVAEIQLRFLAKLPAAVVLAIWQSADTEANGGKITGPSIARKVAEFKLSHAGSLNGGRPAKVRVKVEVETFRSLLRMTYLVSEAISNENHEFALECLGSIQNQLSQIDINGCQICQDDHYPAPEYHI